MAIEIGSGRGQILVFIGKSWNLKRTMTSEYGSELKFLVRVSDGEYAFTTVEVPTAYFIMQGILPRRDIDY